jgi:hypothetical protein
MGQAKRRREQLGALYGTAESSNRLPVIEFREMTTDEVATLEPEKIAPMVKQWGDRLQYVMACYGDEMVSIVVAPVLDEAGQFNSYAAMVSPKAWLLRDWKVQHRKLNRYLLDRADSLVVEVA